MRIILSLVTVIAVASQLYVFNENRNLQAEQVELKSRAEACMGWIEGARVIRSYDAKTGFSTYRLAGRK